MPIIYDDLSSIPVYNPAYFSQYLYQKLYHVRFSRKALNILG